MDGKNTPGSYSALIVLETEEPFCGSYYLLPQYHAALDVRQGMAGHISPTLAAHAGFLIHAWTICVSALA